jgi:tRNA-uridine 2-sulfurtransferase
MTVLVAMSGGVDSSVAAALMKGEGHDVIGVTLKLWQGPNGEAPTAGCCTVGDAEDARRVAAQLDIPYYVFDYTSHFHEGVVDHFVTDYLNGRTPNPCVECNRTVKFSRLLEQAGELGCEMLVTGHYARVVSVAGRRELHRGRDRRKDQSYVLSMLTQRELARVLLPVGELTKDETRTIAAELGLRTASKPDSQDICFVGSEGYKSFLHGQRPDAHRRGRIVDTEGNVVGQHDGVVGFTIGQRRGVGVALGERRYVIDVEPSTATVVIGHRRHLEVSTIVIDQITWVDEPVQPGERVEVQYRAHGQAVPATWTGDSLVCDEPQEAIAPGQTAGLYQGDRVLGGGVIVGTR